MTSDRSDALRRLPAAAWQRWAALGHPDDVATVLGLLAEARAAYRAAFAAWRALSLIDPGYRAGQDECGRLGREAEHLLHIADALGATRGQIDEATR